MGNRVLATDRPEEVHHRQFSEAASGDGELQVPLVRSKNANRKPDGERRSNRREALVGTALSGLLHIGLYEM